eukprot:15366024-Ditylum_brightwellii.AAC.1
MQTSTAENDDNSNGTDDEEESTLNEKIPPSVLWEKEIVCRMPSKNQPWMLQRVKWEQYISSQEKGGGENESDDEKQANELVGWCRVWTGLGDDGDTTDNQSKVWSSDDLDCFLSEKGSFVVQMGAYCTLTNQAKALLRSYDENGILQGVCFQEGKKIKND